MVGHSHARDVPLLYIPSCVRLRSIKTARFCTFVLVSINSHIHYGHTGTSSTLFHSPLTEFVYIVYVRVFDIQTTGFGLRSKRICVPSSHATKCFLLKMNPHLTVLPSFFRNANIRTLDHNIWWNYVPALGRSWTGNWLRPFLACYHCSERVVRAPCGPRRALPGRVN